MDIPTLIGIVFAIIVGVFCIGYLGFGVYCAIRLLHKKLNKHKYETK